MPMPVYPTIVVPGITATSLCDEYPLPPETAWSVLRKEFERISLHPDDLRYEAIEPARVVAGQVFEIVYRELIEELRHNLRSREDLPVPVFPFAYDWRQPLSTSEAQLRSFIDEVIGRTKLLRHYDKEGYGSEPMVNLVGHSMGGLVVAGYLKSAGLSSRVHKVVTLATPFQGSFEAVIKIATGTADLGTSAPSSREREAARITPALYELLPSFSRGLTVSEGLSPTLFDPMNWQPSIVETIKEYIRLRGLDRRDRSAQAQVLFSNLLERAKEYRSRISGLKLSECGLNAASWLCVVGVDSTTRVRLTIEKKGNAAEFQFRTSDRQNNWDSSDSDARRLTGDGTVPFEGALPKFLAPENLVCVTPGDFGYWEVQDRALSAISGFHGILPNMDMVHRMIVAHLSGRPDRHGNIWGRCAPGVASPAWPISDMPIKN